MKQFGIEELNKFNISIAESIKIVNDLEGEKIDLTKSHLLEALRRMSEFFVASNVPIKESE